MRSIIPCLVLLLMGCGASLDPTPLDASDLEVLTPDVGSELAPPADLPVVRDAAPEAALEAATDAAEELPTVDGPDLADHVVPPDLEPEAATPDEPVAEVAVEAAVVDVPAEMPSRVDAPPSCGSSGRACCTGRVCDSGLGCSSASLCAACGTRGAPCCWSGPGSLCPSDLACRGPFGASTCECGNPGEPCCPGFTCNPISGVANACRTVGTRRVCG